MNFGLLKTLAQQQEYVTFPIKVGHQLEIHEYV